MGKQKKISAYDSYQAAEHIGRCGGTGIFLYKNAKLCTFKTN